MPTRQNPDTSIIADRMMTKELREKDRAKILDALDYFPDGAIYTDIATHIGWDDKSKVSRRMKEILDEKDSPICLTGEKRNTPTNRPAQVYRLLKSGEIAPVLPPKEHYMEGQTTASDHANAIIARSNLGKLKQNSLFNSED